jgi:hypothetical protein
LLLWFKLKKERADVKESDGTFKWVDYFNTTYFADPEEQIIGLL